MASASLHFASPHSVEADSVYRYFRIAATCAAMIACLIGNITLIGWWLGIPQLTDFLGVGISMKLNAALAMALAGIGLFLLLRGAPKWQITSCGAIVAALGALTLTQHITGWNFGIDMLLMREDHNMTATASPGRMGPPASTCYTLIGLSLVLLTWGGTAHIKLAQVLLIAAALLALLGLVGSLYRVETLFSVAKYTGISLQTSVGLVILAVGALFARPNDGIMRSVSSTETGGVVIRRLLIAAIALPIAAGWVAAYGEAAGWFDGAFGTAMVALTLLVLFASLIWWTGTALNRATTGNRHLAAIVTSTDDAIISKSLDGTILSWNPGAEQLFGYTAAEAIGRSITMLFPPDRIDEERQILEKIRRGEKVDHFETVRLTKGGKPVEISLTVSPMFDASGRIIGASKIARNISIPRRAQRALNDFFDNGVVGLHLVGADGRVLRANRAEMELLGYSPSEYIGHYVSEFHVDQRAINQLLLRLKHGEVVRDFHAQLRCKNGEIKQVLIDSNVLWENGEFVHTRCFTRDISMQKQAEGTMLRQNRQMQRLYRLSDAVGRATSVEDICELAMDGLIATVFADRASVLLFDNQNVMRFKSWRGLSLEYRIAVEGHSPWQPHDADAQPVVIADVDRSADLGDLKSVVVKQGIRALAFIPLIDRGRLLGKFMVYFNQPRQLTTDELAICRAIAGTIAFSINRNRAELALAASERQLALDLADMTRLHQLNITLLREDDLPDLLCDVLRSSIELLGAAKGNVQLFDEQTNSLHIVTHIGFNDEFMKQFGVVPCGHSVCGEALKQGERLIVENAYEDPRFADLADTYRSYGFIAVQSTPLFNGNGKLMGMLSTHFAEPHRPTERELRLLDLYARQAERIIERKQAEQELQHHRTRLEEIVRDRTLELERTHNQLRVAERMAAIGTLSAGLGHDLGNLLLPVRARLDALRASAQQPESQEHVDAIATCLEYLQRLAQGLRQFALDTDNCQPHDATDLAEWKQQVGSFYRNALARSAQLQWDVPDQPMHVQVARHALTQAIYNLVQNAGEALRGREDGEVRIGAEIVDENWVRLTVSDNGPGMSADVRARCLEPFFTTKTRGLSTGLGLSLVHGVVNRAGGQLDIRSQPGRGTVFSLLLPRAAVKDSESLRPKALVNIASKRVQSYLAQSLSSMGFEVIDSPAQAEGGPVVLIAEATANGNMIERVQEFIEGDESRKALLIGGNGAATDDGRIRTVESDAKPSRIIQQLREMTALPK